MATRILVVEDNPLNAKLARDVLGAKGYDVLEAGNAEDGLVMAASSAPDLILMDIQLPGMDGISALGELRKNEKTAGIPVIAVTASAMPMERKEILAAGFDGYQAKPLSLKDLLSEIETLLGRGEDGG
jgi:CheY-like chemotaxis protein